MNQQANPQSSTNESIAIRSPTDVPESEDKIDNPPTTWVSHGPKFRSLPKEQQNWISKIHHNLGHPNVAKLQNVLKQQGYSDEIIRGLADFHCSTCHETQAPRIARPATLSEAREFNDCIGCDLVSWTSQNGRQHQFLHVVDSATSFQLATPTFRTDAESLYAAYQHVWTQWAGPCKQLVIDNASALCSDQFAKFMQSQDTHLRVVAAYAHWQMGKTERHGETIQQILNKYDHDHKIDSAEDFQQAIRQCCQAKNALSRIKGYTPEILVLGKSRPLPGSLCEDAPTASQFLADSDTPEGIQFRQQLLKRESARKAFVEADNSERLRRAFLRRQRPARGFYTGGTLIMFWRPGRGEHSGQWHGPAKVTIQESQHVVWISHSSRVYRVAPEHVRSLSEREALQIPRCGDQMSENVPNASGGKGVFQYEGLTENIHRTPNISIEAETIIIPSSNNNINQSSPMPDQPDSELSNQHGDNVSVSPSNAYTPMTPPSNPPNDHPNTDEVTDPKDIPIPTDDDDDDDDDDEFVVEDQWLVQKDKLIRIHHKPRQIAFDPSSCSDCPVNILCVSGERFSTGNAVQQPMWMHHDTWGENESHWKTEQPWTGVTIFNIVEIDSMEHTAHHVEDVIEQSR